MILLNRIATEEEVLIFVRQGVCILKRHTLLKPPQFVTVGLQNLMYRETQMGVRLLRASCGVQLNKSVSSHGSSHVLVSLIKFIHTY